MNIPLAVNQCFRKAVFRRFEAAEKRAKYWNKKRPLPDGLFYNTYSCPHCFHYHVGRTKGPHAATPTHT